MSPDEKDLSKRHEPVSDFLASAQRPKTPEGVHLFRSLSHRMLFLSLSTVIVFHIHTHIILQSGESMNYHQSRSASLRKMDT
jgi:hypothetical protein